MGGRHDEGCPPPFYERAITASVGSRAGAVHKVPVSSPRPVERRIRVSRTPLPCRLRIRGYATYRAGRLSGQDQRLHPVVIEDPEHPIDPCLTPPLPAEAPAGPRPHHVAPYLPLDPLPDKAEAPCRIPNPEVVHPAPQDRVDHPDNLRTRLGVQAPEYLLELPQQRRPLPHGRHLLHPPPPPRRAEPAEGEAQEPERLSLSQVHDPALRLVEP